MTGQSPSRQDIKNSCSAYQRNMCDETLDLGSKDVTRDRLTFDQVQARHFDQVVHLFEEPIPIDVQRRMEVIVEAARLRPGERVLDLGTGTGVLLPLILKKNPGTVLACDLSPQMLHSARGRFGNQVTFYQRDIVDMVGQVEAVDVAFFNACFANFYDQAQAIRAVYALLKSGGRLLITHPMGRAFVWSKSQEHPSVVPHELPREKSLQAMLEDVGFELERYTEQPDLYIAVAIKGEV